MTLARGLPICYDSDICMPASPALSAGFSFKHASGAAPRIWPARGFAAEGKWISKRLAARRRRSAARQRGIIGISSRGTDGAAMKTWFGRILIGLVVLVVVAVVGLAIFFADIRSPRQAGRACQANAGDRTLTIDGEIELAVPAYRPRLQGVSLSEAGSKETFASIDSTRLAVARWAAAVQQLRGGPRRHQRPEGARDPRQATASSTSATRGGAAPVVTALANPAEAIAGAAQTAAQAVTSGTLPSSGSNMQIDIAGLDPEGRRCAAAGRHLAWRR